MTKERLIAATSPDNIHAIITIVVGWVVGSNSPFRWHENNPPLIRCEYTIVSWPNLKQWIMNHNIRFDDDEKIKYKYSCDHWNDNDTWVAFPVFYLRLSKFTANGRRCYICVICYICYIKRNRTLMKQHNAFHTICKNINIYFFTLRTYSNRATLLWREEYFSNKAIMDLSYDANIKLFIMQNTPRSYHVGNEAIYFAYNSGWWFNNGMPS